MCLSEHWRSKPKVCNMMNTWTKNQNLALEINQKYWALAKFKTNIYKHWKLEFIIKSTVNQRKQSQIKYGVWSAPNQKLIIKSWVMCVDSCVWIHVCGCVYVCACRCVYACMPVCVCVCMWTCVQYYFMHARVCVCVLVWLCLYVYVCLCER